LIFLCEVSLNGCRPVDATELLSHQLTEAAAEANAEEGIGGGGGARMQ